MRATGDAGGGASPVRRARRSRAARYGVGHGVRFRGLLWLRCPDARRLRASVCGRPGDGCGRPRDGRGRGGGALTGDRSIELCGIRLRGPVLNGSGTFDAIAARRAFGDALVERFPFDAFVSKTITLEPRQGNPPPRLWETPTGLINSIGLPNKGLEGFLRSDLPEIADILDGAERAGGGAAIPLIVSVMGFTRDELASLVAAAGERDEVAMLELNVSCPNVETG